MAEKNKIDGGATIWARKTIESDIFFWKPDKWFKIWFFIVNKANHKDNHLFKRGVNFFTYNEIQRNTRATAGQIDHCIRWLKSATQIATQKTTRGMIITVINYDFYQKLENYYYKESDTIGETSAKHKRHYKQECNNERINNDFAEAKSLLKVKTKKMQKNTNAFEDEYDKKIDYDSQEEIKPLEKKEGRNKIAGRLQNEFVKMAEKEIGHKPIYSKAGYVLLCRALKIMSEKDILDSLKDWFNESKKEEDLIQITQALSNNRLNRWRVNK